MPAVLHAQGFGSFGDAGGFTNGRRLADFNKLEPWSFGDRLPTMDPEAACQVITVEATIEERVVPEEIRVVLALISEGATVDLCQADIAKRIDAVKKEWAELGIGDDRMVADFISVLPYYEWHASQRDEQDVLVQQQAGYRMQTNLHVAVASEAEAMAAIGRAFQQGVRDVVTFDYWSHQINERKVQARQRALMAAKQKADTLLALFDERPKVINVQERADVFFPRSLYRTYENVLEESEESDWRKLPRIKAYRPKKTFYQGLESNSDEVPMELAMRPEIAIVATVRLYFQSPAEYNRGHEESAPRMATAAGAKIMRGSQTASAGLVQ